MRKKRERFVLPNGVKVSFEPTEHKYFVNGKEVPSITTLLQEHYGNKYAMVRPEILKAAADYGTAVHSEIESYINLRKKDPKAVLVTEHDEVKNYFNIVEPVYEIEPLMTEKVVVLYGPDNKVAAAGRFDMLGTVKGKTTLIDFKTTSTINRQSVSAQLNLYLTGLLQSGYVESIDDIDIGVVHLSGMKSTYTPLMKFDKDFYLTFVI
jgi:hypothetical protein